MEFTTFLTGVGIGVVIGALIVRRDVLFWRHNTFMHVLFTDALLKQALKKFDRTELDESIRAYLGDEKSLIIAQAVSATANYLNRKAAKE